MADTTTKIYQLIIVGGGPVGLALAIDLGLRNVSCLVIEKHLDIPPIPKGQNLTQRTMEHFYFWGLENELRAERLVSSDASIGGVTALQSLLSEHWYPWYTRGVVRPFYYRDNERLPQFKTEAVLRHKAESIDCVDVVYGRRVTSLDQGAQTVQVQVAATADQSVTLYSAQYVVGCDGARSTIRGAAGIRQTVNEHQKLMALLVFRSPELRELLKRFPERAFFKVLKPELCGYWEFLGRVDDDARFFFHAPLPPGVGQDDMDPEALLERAIGRPVQCEIEHVGVWDMRIAIADSYRQGRVFLAGDAAHSHPPYGGYGINTGFEDARNLGWKLAACLQGRGGDDLLDSYNEERRPVFTSIAADFIEQEIADDLAFLQEYNPNTNREEFETQWLQRSNGSNADILAFAPNYAGSRLVSESNGKTCDARGGHSFEARPGHHLPPRRLASGLSVYENLESEFTLIALGAAQDDTRSFRDAAEDLNMTLNIILDRYEGEVLDYLHPWILVRPDQFVTWVGEGEPSSPPAILRRATGNAL